MGVSFKISKVGSRFKPKPVLSEKNSENSVESSQPKAKKDESNAFITNTSARKLGGRDEDAAGFSSPSLSSGRHLILSEDDTSFVLNLYLDGYSIGKPSESENLHNVVFQDGAKLLHPYDRSSESLFAAIESGRLPGDILEDMPCKYMDGQIICEVRDYRRCILDSGCNIPSRDMSPVVTKVQLKMSLENVVKDIPLIADDSWSYGDLMEVESRILRALQPKLCLDPTPRLDRLSDSSLSPKLNLGLSGMRKRRLRQISEVVTSFSKPYGKKTCLGSFSESSGLGESGVVSADIMSQSAHTQNVCSNVPSTRSRGSVHDNSPQAIHAASPESKFQLGDQRIMPHISGSALNTSSGAFPAVHDVTKVHPDNMNSTNLLHAKMENEEGQLSSFSSLNKKARHFGPEGTLPPLMGSCINSLQPSDTQWRNPPHHQGNARGMHFPNTGIQKYAHVMCDGASNQEGMTSASIGQLGRKYGVSGEHLETEKIDTPEVKHGKNVMQMFDAENNHMDPSILQRVPTQIMRSGLNQGVWHNIGYVDKDPRKEDLIQRRKLIQSPRNSAGSGAHFPLSAKSAELSCGSLVNQYAAVPSAAAPGSLQREKSGVPSIPAGGRTPSVNSSANDSVHQHHQSHVPAKRRSNSLPKTQAMSGVGSPASVSNANVPMSAASPSVGTSPFADHTLIERFSKIEMVNMKHQLNAKKNRSDDFSRTSSTFSSQLLRARLSDSNNDESTMSLSKSFAGGNINLPKIRVLTLIQAERTLQGNSVPFPPRAKTRMIMSEKPGDGTVAMHYGDLEDVPYLNAEDYLPNLPNTHFADLLAAEFSRLVDREGYYVEDRVHCRPPHTSISTSTQPSASGVASSNPTTEMQQHSEAVSAPQTGEGAKPFSANTSVNPSPNFLPSSGRLPLGSPQALQMSQGLLHGVSMPARSQQLDPPQTHQQQQSPLQNQPPLIQPQQQQQTQFQRSLMMPPNSLSPIQNSNFQLGNQMMNKPSLHVLQQQQQPQLQPQMQQQHMQRKMMTGGAAMGMGNMANNMAGGLNIGGARGIGAAGITAPMVAIPGMGNMGQNPMSINHASNFSNALSQHLRSGALTHEQAQIFAARMRVAQNRSVLGGPQSSVPDIAGTRQMQPGSTGHSMLGQTLNRGNFSPMQRTPLGQMTPQKLMPGMHAHVSSQQQQQQQQQLQQQMQHQQQQQLRQQLQQQQLQQLPPSTTQLQQETSPLQAVVSPQISSSSTLGIPHSLNQQPTPQQQQASPQISSGTMQPMASVNPEAGAASPQLSSGGNIANSPMDFQGVNKSSSLGNT